MKDENSSVYEEPAEGAAKKKRRGIEGITMSLIAFRAKNEELEVEMKYPSRAEGAEGRGVTYDVGGGCGGGGGSGGGGPGEPFIHNYKMSTLSGGNWGAAKK